MSNASLARKAGIIGMAAALLWIGSVIMQYSLGLFNPDGSALYILHQLISMTALIGMVIGYLGLIWGGAVRNRFGKMAVYLYALGYGLIVIASLAGLFLYGEDNPLSLFFPVGGILWDIGALLIGIAVATAKRWSGWQRFMPLVSFLVIFFGVNLPFFLRAGSDGPGMAGELVMAACWFGVALAVYTVSARQVMPQLEATAGRA